MFKDIESFIQAKRNPFFYVSHDVAKGYDCGNKQSYYAKKFPDSYFSFDVSNNKVLVNVDERGVISHLTFYRNDYACDDIPGVWRAKDFSISGPFSFDIFGKNGQNYRLQDSSINYCSDLVDNLFPRTQFNVGEFSITTFAFTPIGKNRRLDLVVYGLFLKHCGKEKFEGKIRFTGIPCNKGEYFNNPSVSFTTLEDNRCLEQSTGARLPVSWSIDTGLMECWVC